MGLLALATLLIAPLAEAQQLPPGGVRPAPQVKAPAPAARESAPGSDAALQRRIEQLEEQLVDMQVVVGTLESLARGAGGSAGNRSAPGPSAAVGAADAGRLDALETQIGALAAQLEQLQEQVRAIASRGGALSPSASHAAADPAPRPGFGRLPPAEAPPVQPQPQARPGFGSVTVQPDASQRDDIDRILTGPRAGAPSQTAAVPTPAGGGESELAPKQLYEQAYGYLLQRDYGAAEAAFDDFLKRHPSDPLAGNAQYWLGETHYVRGNYRAAANAFLKGYQGYGKSAKAPESLLKLAMSLQRLGQKEAACTSFTELATRFPSAPAHVKTTAQTERQRGGC